MPVEDQNPNYTNSLNRWNLVKDCTSGSEQVKSRDSGKKYLPMPNKSDQSIQNIERYRAYLLRANYVNFTGHTKKGMIGMVFRRDITLDLPSTISYIEKDATGGGLSLNQIIKSTIYDLLETGRHGFLVDYPRSEGNLTQEQILNLGLKANILQYHAENIINWRIENINGMRKISLVVLYEQKEKIASDGFSSENITQYRVLRLVDNVYHQEIYDCDSNLISSYAPTDASGQTWSLIPFTFVGSINNDEIVDDAPLYDMAEVNLAHYRNSADYEESCFIVGQPTPILSGLTQSWVDDVLKGQVHLGSRSAIPLPEGGSAMLLQANPNQMPLEGMREKEMQMMKIGARMIQDGSGSETVDAVKIRYANQTSELAAIVGNVESALLSCFNWLIEYMGGNGSINLVINKEFYDSSLNAQQAMSLIQFADRGDISQNDVRGVLRRSGWIKEDKTDEDIDSEVEGSGNGLQLGNE